MALRKKKLAPKKNMDGRWRVAVHEAGHAVAAHTLGIRIDRVTIVGGATADGERYEGFAGFGYDLAALRKALDEYYDAEDDDDDDDREERTFFLLMKSMQVSFGGKVAEELFFGAAEETGITSDLESVNTCADRLCPPDPKEIQERTLSLSLDMGMDAAMAEAIKLLPELPKQEHEFFCEWVEHRVRKLLRNRQDLIEAVASRLLERETLTGGQVVTTILGALKARSTQNAPPVSAEVPRAGGR